MHTNKCTNKQQDGGGDLKTSLRKGVINIEADENTLPDGFDDPLLFGSFKLAGKAPNICLNGDLTSLLTSTSFPLARNAN